MKSSTIKLLSLAVASSLVLSSCKKYLEDDVVSPNDPENTTAALLLANMEVATFATFGGQLARQNEVLIQRMAGTNAGSQSIDIAQYSFTEISNQNEWDVIYTGIMANARIMLADYGSGSPHYAGITKVLMAMNIGLATDLWGDVPFDQAGLGLDNLEPAFQTQQSVIQGIQDLLDDAIVDLSAPAADNVYSPSVDDYIFGGDATLWTKTAYLLKARYANRLSKRDANGSATAALAALTNAISSSAEDCNMVFFNAGNSLNQWFAYEGQRGGYLRAGATFVDTLAAIGDPRLDVFFGLDENGGISGTPYDDVGVTGTSYVGDYYAGAESSIPLCSYVEAKFIEAEANLRLGNAQPAADALNDAVKASILQVTGAADPVYEALYASETALTVSLDKIMFQKYIALFLQAEGYSDWRRTGIPALTPNPNGAHAGIPRRLPTPQQERLYNSNATVVGDVLLPVWWDE